MQPVLAIRNLEVVYNDVALVLRGVSLDVGDGAIVALLGANGAGKTTLLRAVTGLLPQHRGRVTKGSVTFDGDEITRLDAAAVVRRGVSQVMEGRRIFSELTVDENLRAGSYSRTSRTEVRESHARVMELFPVLAGRRKSVAGYLSGGEQQMLAIGRALMASPRLLLLDEPSLGLAPKIVEQVRDIIVTINEAGTSVLLVEQNAMMALSVATTGYVLETGRVVRDGPADELMADDDIREFYLGAAADGGDRRSLADVKSYRRREAVECMTALLSVENLVLRFGGVTALDGVSFDVAAGELFAVIGPNGAGKTSIFNCLNGVYRPQEGTIRFDGESLGGLKPVRIAERGVARTFQNIGLFPNVSLVDNLMLGRHHLMRTGFVAGMVWWGRARREEIEGRAAVERVVELLELEPYRLMPAGLLPYGVAKRAELARALAMEPRLLLLDEPVAGMNLEETEDMARHIVEVRRELGLAMILVEHDMRLVMDLADRVMALDFGKVLTTGTPAEVQRHPEVVRAYLGGAA